MSKNAILLGDFNFGDKEIPETKHLNKNYIDVWLSTNANQKGFTYDIVNNDMAKKGAFKGDMSRRIDRILIKSKLAAPLNTTIIGNKTIKGSKTIFPSDHYGLKAVVLIK